MEDFQEPFKATLGRVNSAYQEGDIVEMVDPSFPDSITLGRVLSPCMPNEIGNFYHIGIIASTLPWIAGGEFYFCFWENLMRPYILRETRD